MNNISVFGYGVFAICFICNAQDQSTTTVLSEVIIETAADASADGLPEAYAGGEVARGARIGVLGTQDIMDTPFAVTSYTNELMHNQQAKNISDVLLNDAGVRKARGFGNFQQTYFIRGFTVYSDDVAYNGLYGLLSRQYMAVEFIERLEVFRGANAFLGNAGAGIVSGGSLGGLINIVPKRAKDEPFIKISTGINNNSQSYIAVDASNRYGNNQLLGARVNVASLNGNTAIDKEHSATNVSSLGLDWHNDNIRLSADLGWQEHKLTAPRPAITPSNNLPILKPPKAKTNYAGSWTYSNSNDVFGTVRSEFDFLEQFTSWIAVGARNGKENNSLAGLNLIDINGFASHNRFDNTRRSKIKTGEIGIRSSFNLASIKNNLVFSLTGFDSSELNAWGYNYATGVVNNIYQPINITIPDLTGFGGILGSPRETERIKTNSISVANTLNIFDDYLLLTIGMRNQNIRVTSFDVNNGLRTGNYNKSRVTPIGAIVVKVNPAISLYSNYIEGLVKGTAAPAISGGNAVINAGEIFAPYVSKQKELGIKYDGIHIGASVAFFTTNMPSAYVVNNIYGVFGKQRNQGLEFSLFGEPTPNLSLISGLTLLNAKYKLTKNNLYDNNRVVGVPQKQANISANWNVLGDTGLSINARFLYTGSQYANSANSLFVPSWRRLDLGVNYLFNFAQKPINFNVRIDNITNKNYWESVGGYATAGYLVLGAPRTFSFTVSADF